MKKLLKNRRVICAIAIVAVILGAVAAVKSCADKIEPDMVISYIGENYFDSERFYDEIAVLEGSIKDINNDGKKKIEISVISFGSSLTAAQEQANLSKLTVSMGQGESRVYIMDKAYCQRYADNEVLADLSEFASEGEAVLTDSSGKVYAISVEGNPLLNRLGLDDTEKVYIALRAVTEMDYVNFKSPSPEEIDTEARGVVRKIVEQNIK